MQVTEDNIFKVFSDWRARYEDRNERMDIIDSLIRGDFSVFDPDEEEVENRSPNMVQVAMEDTAAAASLLPTLRVEPGRKGVQARKQADLMEKIGQSYLEFNRHEQLVQRTILKASALGFGVWTVLPDFTHKMPVIELRNPRNCYPEPGYMLHDQVRRCLFARDLYFSQLPEEWVPFVEPLLIGTPADHLWGQDQKNQRVTILEWFDESEYVIFAMVSPDGGTFMGTTSSTSTAVEIARSVHGLSFCPVVLEARPTLDDEFRGQFDQVVGIQLAQTRLFGMLMDYADQSIYSEVWVKDPIGEVPWGGGALIELGPQGDIGRLPPAVSGLDVQRDLLHLSDSIHLGARWPKSRPGDIDQSIASAKYLEASAGMMNTVIRDYHTMLRRMLNKAVRIAFEVDHKFFSGTKTASGSLRNGFFIEDYNPKTDIDLKHRANMDYGLGFGRDPAQALVMMLQSQSRGFLSIETVQENMEGLYDVQRERQRVDAERMRDMMLAMLLQGVEQGTIPKDALVKIYQGRLDGEQLHELFDTYIGRPEREALEAAVPTGMGQAPVGPQGQPVTGSPGQPPGQVPPGPTGAEMLSRLTAQGNVAGGVQVGGPG